MKKKIGEILCALIILFVPTIVFVSVAYILVPNSSAQETKEKVNGPDYQLHLPNDFRQAISIGIGKEEIVLCYVDTDNEPKAIKYWGESYEHVIVFRFEKD